MAHIEQTIQDVKQGVSDASAILAENNPELAKQWDTYPDSRRHVAGIFAAQFLLGRSSGTTTLPLNAQKVWGAAVDDKQHRALFPEYFTD